jgi:fatty acid desaturase
MSLFRKQKDNAELGIIPAVILLMAILYASIMIFPCILPLAVFWMLIGFCSFAWSFLYFMLQPAAIRRISRYQRRIGALRPARA